MKPLCLAVDALNFGMAVADGNIPACFGWACAFLTTLFYMED